MRNVVVLGCPRSGTSLLLELFEALGWHTFFEPGADFVRNDMARVVAEGLPIGRPPQTAGERHWAIKNPVDHWPTPGLTCNLEALRHWTGPDTAYFWIVRHPLDTICSLRPGLEDRWGHQPYPTMWAELMAEPWHVRAAWMWRWCNIIGFPQFANLRDDLHPWHLNVVRYEGLLADPRRAVEEMCELTWHVPAPKAVDRAVRKVSRNVGGPEAAIQDRWARRDHATHVGRWRENLTRTQIHEIRLVIADDYWPLWGYDVEELLV